MPEGGEDRDIGERAGLCASCVHARRVVNDRGSVFVRCAYAAIDPAFAKYPRLPVRACAAYTPGTTPH